MKANVFIILQIFFVTWAVLKIGEYSPVFPNFRWGIFGHVTCLDQSRTSKKIWWIITTGLQVHRSLLYLFCFCPLVIARQLDKHTIGYITYRAGMQSSMTTTLIRETENSKAVITIQVLICSSCKSPWCANALFITQSSENKGLSSKFSFY